MVLALPAHRAAVLTPKAPTPLLRASFTAPDGTALGSYAPEVGPVGVALRGTWDIQGNRLNSSGAGPGGLGWLAGWDVGKADVDCSAAIVLPSSFTSNTGGGIAARIADNANYWLVNVQPFDSTLRIYEAVAGGFFQRASAAYTYTVSTTVTLRVVVRGTALSAYLNGVLLATWPAMATGAGKTVHGFREGSGGGDLFFDTAAIDG